MSRAFVRDLTVKHNWSAVHEDMFDASRVMKRIVVRSPILNRCRVEDCNISHHSGPQNAAVGNANPARSLRGHLADRFFQAHGVLNANVFGKYSSKRAK